MRWNGEYGEQQGQKERDRMSSKDTWLRSEHGGEYNIHNYREEQVTCTFERSRSLA